MKSFKGREKSMNLLPGVGQGPKLISLEKDSRGSLGKPIIMPGRVIVYHP